MNSEKGLKAYFLMLKQYSVNDDHHPVLFYLIQMSFQHSTAFIHFP